MSPIPALPANHSDLIHMNGRIYDPRLGRMLQADPFVQDAKDSQSLNRYTYVRNNPLSYTDPSGYFVRELVNFARAVIRIVGSEGADLTAWADLIASGIALLRSLDKQQVGVAAGVVVGAFGGFAVALRGRQPQATDAQEIVDSFTDVMLATIGGTASEITGEKFANGAATGTFSRVLNGEARRRTQRIEPIPWQRMYRRGPGIHITGHRVAGSGPVHLAIEFVPDDGSGPSWISAGPENGLLVSGVDGERPTDMPSLNFTIGRVSPPSGLKPSNYYQILLEADRAYCDCVDYDLFPEVGNSYNSNSFVRGLIEATGGTATIGFNDYSGGFRALPKWYFGYEK